MDFSENKRLIPLLGGLGVVLLIVIWFFFFTGPASKGGVSVEGTVNYDGKPLGEGYITFSPAPGSKGVTAGGPIKDGKFSLTSTQGPPPGEYKVLVSMSYKTGKKINSPGGQVDEVIDLLFEKYGSAAKTPLSQSIKSGANQLEPINIPKETPPPGVK